MSSTVRPGAPKRNRILPHPSDLFGQGGYICRDQILVAGICIEVAIGATRPAKWDVKVNADWRHTRFGPGARALNPISTGRSRNDWGDDRPPRAPPSPSTVSRRVSQSHIPAVGVPSRSAAPGLAVFGSSNRGLPHLARSKSGRRCNLSGGSPPWLRQPRRDQGLDAVVH